MSIYGSTIITSECLEFVLYEKYAVKLLNKVTSECTLNNFKPISNSITLRKVPIS